MGFRPLPPISPLSPLPNLPCGRGGRGRNPGRGRGRGRIVDSSSDEEGVHPTSLTPSPPTAPPPPTQPPPTQPQPTLVAHTPNSSPHGVDYYNPFPPLWRPVAMNAWGGVWRAVHPHTSVGGDPYVPPCGMTIGCVCLPPVCSPPAPHLATSSPPNLTSC